MKCSAAQRRQCSEAKRSARSAATSTTDLREVVSASISMPSGKGSFQVRGVGDVNGDGYDDIMMGNVDDYTYGTGAGRAHLFYGRQGGLGE